MLNHLSIKDFAVIENTSVDFNDGLNIITGETGAGKSVVIEGISLALGARADSSFIRTGCSKAIVQLVGDLDGEDIIISREISSNGKNICKLNGEIVPLSQLKETCQKLADIHGQYDNQFLLNPENHIFFLDQFGKAKVQPIIDQVSALYKDYAQKKQELSTLLKNEREMKQKLDYYEFQLKDIDSLNLKTGEDEALEEEVNLLQNSEKIYGNLDDVYHSVYGQQDSVLDNLYASLKALEEISSFSKDIDEIKNTFSDTYYSLDDLKNTIRDLRDSISFSPSQLDAAILRLEQIKEAKSKYGNTIEEILNYRESINDILGDSIDFEHKKNRLYEEVKQTKELLLAKCGELTNMRKALALELEKLISRELIELNFNNANISINFKSLEEPTVNGLDDVEILISTNKGEDLKPLSKVASGGEMSRIMLAFKKITSAEDSIETLIFDEIDNGISGITASIVSKKLKEIAENHQIICITHLPQIAASGKTNYRIVKSEDNAHTYTTIQELSYDEKVNEIARLLGGINITDTTLKSAKELIESTK